MRTITALASVLTLTACAPKPPPPSPEQQAVAAAESAVRAGLRDPDSARFSQVWTVKAAPSGLTVCGYVNARNGFNGYSGPQRFYVYPGSAQAIILEDGGKYDGMWVVSGCTAPHT